MDVHNTIIFDVCSSFQVPKEKRLLPVAKVVEITEEQEKRSVAPEALIGPTHTDVKQHFQSILLISVFNDDRIWIDPSSCRSCITDCKDCKTNCKTKQLY